MTNPRRVADLTGFDILDPYFWTSEEHIVLLRHVAGPHAEDAGHFEVLVHDVTTERREPMETFNAACAPLLRGEIMYLISGGTQEITYSSPLCSLSSDNRWLAAFIYSPGLHPAWLAAPLKPDAGQRLQTYDVPDDLDPEMVSGIHPAWLPDSRRWVALIQVYDNYQHWFPRMVVHDTQDPAADRTIAITDLPGMLVLGVTTAQRPSGAFGEAVLLYDLDMDRDAQRHGGDTIEIYAVPLNADTATVQAEHWTVPLPGRGDLAQVALSPDGNRLASLTNTDTDTGSSWQVWISGLNGEEMHAIEILPEISEAQPDVLTGEPQHFLCNLAWLPNGRAVSFRSVDALWIASVE